MTEKHIAINSSVIHYLQTGEGEKHLVLFHGFGQTHQAFLSHAERLRSKYTLYIFDLFFHGKSFWAHGEEPLKKDEWKKFMEQFVEEHNVEKFSLAGFSMGGKFALATLEIFPEKIDKLFLIAADGVDKNIWYHLATSPVPLRMLFRSMILHPKRLEFITRAAQRLGLITKTLKKFVTSQMNTPEKRSQVYHSWVVFRPLKFDLKKIAAATRRRHIPIVVVVGRHDRIINYKRTKKLLKDFRNLHFEILETGHGGLLENERLYQLFIED